MLSRDRHEDATRHAYAKQQEEFLRALVSNGPLPPGFDPDRAEILARALARKRGRAVARAWPALEHILGSSYECTFAAFARTRPLRAAHAVEDGLAFITWLGTQWLDDPACIARARLRYAVSGRTVGRQPSFVGFARARSGAITVAVRFGLGATTRLLRVPEPLRRRGVA